MLFTKHEPMATNRITMRQIQETLRLHLCVGSHRYSGCDPAIAWAVADGGPSLIERHVPAEAEPPHQTSDPLVHGIGEGHCTYAPWAPQVLEFLLQAPGN